MHPTASARMAARCASITHCDRDLVTRSDAAHLNLQRYSIAGGRTRRDDDIDLIHAWEARGNSREDHLRVNASHRYDGS